MNGLLLVLFGGLAVAVIFAYLGGRQAGLGRGEQDRGDLAEENTALRKYVGGLEERVTAQHHRIVAMTAWETVPWPDGRTSPVPVRPEVEPAADIPWTPPAIVLAPRIPRPRRERRTSTAAFLDPPGPERTGEVARRMLAAGMYWDEDQQDWVPDPAVWYPPEATHETRPDDQPDGPPIERDGWWRDLEDEIWAAKLWLATL